MWEAVELGVRGLDETTDIWLQVRRVSIPCHVACASAVVCVSMSVCMRACVCMCMFTVGNFEVRCFEASARPRPCSITCLTCTSPQLFCAMLEKVIADPTYTRLRTRAATAACRPALIQRSCLACQSSIR